jgi:GTP-binding protein
VHLLDLNPIEDDRTPWTDFLAINHELDCFNPDLARRPQIVVATKMDVPSGTALPRRATTIRHAGL